MNAELDLDAITEHFEWWFDGAPGLVAVTSFPSRRTQFTDDRRRAAKLAHSAGGSVYVRQTTLSCRPKQGRGAKGDTGFLPGFWLDLDVATEGHHAEGVELPDTETALSIMLDLMPTPSAIVASGGGYYPLWKFTEPRDCRGRIDKATDYLDTLQGSAARIVNGEGYHLDNVAELARILRPVGSLNRKTEPAKRVVWELAPDDGAGTYDYRELAARFADLTACYPEREPLPALQPPPRQPPPRADGDPSVIDNFEDCFSLADVLARDPRGWEQVRSDQHFDYWRFAGASSASEYSIKQDHNTGVVIVWSETVAAELGVTGSGGGLTLWQFHCALQGQDPRNYAAELMRDSRTRATEVAR